MLKLQHLSHTVLVSTLSRETFNTVKLLFLIMMMIFFLCMSVFSFLGWYSCKRFFFWFSSASLDSFVVIRPFRCQKKTSSKFFHVPYLSVLKCYKNNFSFFVCVVLKFVCFGNKKYIFLPTYWFAHTQNFDFFSSLCDGSGLVGFVFGS